MSLDRAYVVFNRELRRELDALMDTDDLRGVREHLREIRDAVDRLEDYISQNDAQETVPPVDLSWVDGGR